ncbi:hypothetical protein KSP40_PGU010135 [Platanthera guangdongensis]|uniref:Uncharacterized protein n=1 Tax=Platanthera guangdongensis TaxID=2320717 RepID=A0ABR2LMJ9_9ASPA
MREAAAASPLPPTSAYGVTPSTFVHSVARIRVEIPRMVGGKPSRCHPHIILANLPGASSRTVIILAISSGASSTAGDLSSHLVGSELAELHLQLCIV